MQSVHSIQDSKFEAKSPGQILEWALNTFESIGIAFSGAEDVVLIDMAVRIKSGIDVFSIDSGRLHPETYEFIERVRDHYGIPITLLSPDPHRLQSLVREKGLFSFYRDGHAECCAIRKVEPLRRKLSTLQAWITGQRRDQSPATRLRLPAVERDGMFSRPGATLAKINPLTAWSSAQVWQYIHDHEVPYNALHEKGYVSIGCQPCTRPVPPHRHEREGRWWWEDGAKRECGLHTSNAVRRESVVNG